MRRLALVSAAVAMLSGASVLPVRVEEIDMPEEPQTAPRRPKMAKQEYVRLPDERQNGAEKSVALKRLLKRKALK